MSSFKAEKLPVFKKDRKLKNIIIFEKDRKREQAEYLGSHCFREENKEDGISIVTKSFFKAEKLPVSQEYHYI